MDTELSNSTSRLSILYPSSLLGLLLGDKVLIIEVISGSELGEVNIWSICMELIPGKTWLEFDDEWGEILRVKCTASLGTVPSKCFVTSDSSSIVDTVILRDDLHGLRANTNEDLKLYYLLVDKLIKDSL
ncbi:hypothetical protein MMC18_009047 [Xylographa bjoerkii]|nr:hypothetical protein [Xylographa bjoerkii]